jgi:hypothetical protein
VSIFQGIGLFLFIPLVLFLFLAFPLGVLPSICAGVVIMFGHRFIARPYMLRNIDKRCLWSGRQLKKNPRSFILRSRKGDLTFYANTLTYKENSVRFFNFVDSAKIFLKPAILGTLAWYLCSVTIGEINPNWRYLARDTFVQIFKLVIALTVLSGSFLYRMGKTVEPVNAVFPVHNFFLLGIRWILWVFRIVGTWWIVQWFLITF